MTALAVGFKARLATSCWRRLPHGSKNLSLPLKRSTQEYALLGTPPLSAPKKQYPFMRVVAVENGPGFTT